jgi:hypothetical protein
MTAPAVERAERMLAQRARTIRTGLVLAATAAVLAPAALALSPQLSLALLVGAVVQLVACAVQRARIAGLVGRLALDPAAYAIPAVRDYGVRLTLQRARLGAWLVEVIDEADRPESLYLADRVAHYRAEILAAAHGLMAPEASVEPVCLATCRRLLTMAPDSPLYNDNLPAVDLGSALYRIRAGIAADASAAGAR